MKINAISLEEKRTILKAVMEAERFTSVEFLVHIDLNCKEEVIEKASGIFKLFHLNKTKEKNWVLFYFSIEDGKYAIIGDEEINKIVPEHFWEEIKGLMMVKIIEGKLSESLSEGITLAGEKMKLLIPKNSNDYNEFPDEIFIGSGIEEVVV